MSIGQDLYKKAKGIIPGGTQLLSKRPEMFLPDNWPTYYDRAHGCRVWDLDGNAYDDMSYMGIGACVLGYADEVVDAAAVDAINRGQMSTLNAPEEVTLAEKLLELHPWAGGVRYAKAGGEAMALAVRIARAATRKDIILFSGYHGWHDWYLAANICADGALDDHLLKGLDSRGVPRGLEGSTFPFHYNDQEEFDALIEKYSERIAAVVMEPIRNDYPNPGFLEHIRSTTEAAGIALVFDEITAGFRLCVGGSHLKLGVQPDIAVFGKALANGYPLTAVIGRESIMQAAQSTFISSTFHTERIGFAAALACIAEFESRNVADRLTVIGAKVKKLWRDASEKSSVPIIIGGIDPLAHFAFHSKRPRVEKTLFTQEMLKRGFLASTACYASYAHIDEVINRYEAAVNAVFEQISCINETHQAIEDFLEGPVCHGGFERLN